MVTDLQGVAAGGQISFTDPQVLSVEQSFGRADLGHPAMHRFFAFHRCGELCKAMSLVLRDV